MKKFSIYNLQTRRESVCQVTKQNDADSWKVFKGGREMYQREAAGIHLQGGVT